MDEIEARSKAGGGPAAAPRCQPRSASPARRSPHPSPSSAAPAAGGAVSQPEARAGSRGHLGSFMKPAAALGAVPGVSAAAARPVTANGHSAAADVLAPVAPASQPAAGEPTMPPLPAPQSIGESFAASPPASPPAVSSDAQTEDFGRIMAMKRICCPGGMNLSLHTSLPMLTDQMRFCACSSPCAGYDATTRHAETGTSGRFEAVRRRLYSTEGVPGFLTAAADELRAAHPGVPFLDHAWGQVCCCMLASFAL